MNCPNLRELYGERYKVVIEENLPTKDPWYFTIPCRSAHICPWGPNLLGVCTSGRGSVAKRLLELPFITVEQDGGGGLNLSFDPKYFDSVAQIVKPCRRRRLSEAQRRAGADRLRRFQFKPAAQSPNSTRESPAGPQRVSEHVQTAERPF